MIRKFSRAAFALVIVAAVALAIAPTQAQAVVFSGTGTVGAVQIPRVVGRGGMSDLTFPQRFAWRAPAYTNSVQVIDVVYSTFRWNRNSATWTFYSGASGSRQAAAGTSGAWLPGWTAIVLPGEYFRVEVDVRWRTTSGYVIGSRNFNYNFAGDYECGNPSYCTTGPGGYILLW